MIYKLEKRILFDAALPLDIDEAAQDLNTAHLDAAAEQAQFGEGTNSGDSDTTSSPNDGDTTQGHPADDNAAADATDHHIPGLEPLSEVSSEQNTVQMLLVSSNVADAEVLAGAAQEHVAVVEYDAQTTDLNELLQMITEQAAGRPVSNLAIATHDLGPGQFVLTADVVVNLGAALSNQDQMAFWQDLGELMAPQGRIDLLACNLTAEVPGEILVSQLENLTGCNIAASDDITGNPLAGGDWILETDNVDLVPIYFDAQSLANYTSNLFALETKLIAGQSSANAFGGSVAIDNDTLVVGLYPQINGVKAEMDGVYVFHKDGGDWYRIAKLLGDDTQLDDQFGLSVAIDGNTIVVGAPYDDDGGSDSGSAYIFEKVGNYWEQTAKLTATDATAGDHFGYSVAVADATIIVGSPYNDSAFSDSGAAYIFEKPVTGWTDMTSTYKLQASTPHASDTLGFSVAIDDSQNTVLLGGPALTGTTGVAWVLEKDPVSGWANYSSASLSPTIPPNNVDFGYSVAIEGDIALVGAPGLSTPHGGNYYVGAVYLFENPGGAWQDMHETTWLHDSNDQDNAMFGYSVDIDGDLIIVGAGLPNSGSATGHAYIFEKPAGGWSAQSELTEDVELTNPSPFVGDMFGVSVAIDDGTAVVGAPGVPANPLALNNPTAVYVFEESLNWNNSATLHSSGGETFQFGYSVSIDGDTAVIGAPFYYSTSNSDREGAAYIFEKVLGIWHQAALLKAAMPESNSWFGASVDILGDLVIVGAPYGDGGGNHYGTAYIFEKPVNGWTDMNETGTLVPTSITYDAGFGTSVAIAGDTAVVGAPDAGVFHNASYIYSGAVYVFEKGIQTDWSDANKAVLSSSDLATGDKLGTSVAVDETGENIVAGAPGKSNGAANSQGAIYIFEKPGVHWLDATENALRRADDGADGDQFGTSVAIDADTLLVGAPYADKDVSTLDSGAAYIFERNGGVWNNAPSVKLVADDAAANDHFGQSVALANDVALVGAEAGGSNDTGAVYVFENTSTWSTANNNQSQLIASDGVSGDYFGCSVALLDEDTAIIGAPRDDGNDGAAYIFDLANQAPVNNLPADQNTDEDTALVFDENALISISDIDAGNNDLLVNLTVNNGVLSMGDTSLLSSILNNNTSHVEMTGSLVALNKALYGMTYTPDLNFYGSEQLTIVTDDQGHNGVGGPQQDVDLLDITVNPVNDAPVLSDTVVVLDSVAEDAGAPAGAVGTLVDNLVDLDPPTGGQDNVTDGDIGALTGMAIIGTERNQGTWYYSTDNGANWNLLGPVAEDSARLLAVDNNTRIYFAPDADYNGTIDTALTFRAWDQTSGSNGQGGVDTTNNGGSSAFSSTTDTAALTVTPVNDAPVNNVPESQDTDEDTPLVFNNANGNAILVDDVDADGQDLEVTLEVHNGIINVSSSTATVSNNATARVTILGTITEINKALDGMTYSPNLNYNGPDELSITTDDLGHTGAGGPLSTMDTVLLTILAVNDAPVNTVPGSQTTEMNTPLFFSSDNQNELAVDDVDMGPWGTIMVTLESHGGVMTLATTDGLIFSEGDGVADDYMVFSASLVDANNALDGLCFDPLQDYTGSASIRIISEDHGQTGSGSDLSDDDTVTITITEQSSSADEPEDSSSEQPQDPVVPPVVDPEPEPNDPPPDLPNNPGDDNTDGSNVNDDMILPEEDDSTGDDFPEIPDLPDIPDNGDETSGTNESQESNNEASSGTEQSEEQTSEASNDHNSSATSESGSQNTGDQFNLGIQPGAPAADASNGLDEQQMLKLVDSLNNTDSQLIESDNASAPQLNGSHLPNGEAEEITPELVVEESVDPGLPPDDVLTKDVPPEGPVCETPDESGSLLPFHNDSDPMYSLSLIDLLGHEMEEEEGLTAGEDTSQAHNAEVGAWNENAALPGVPPQESPEQNPSNGTPNDSAKPQDDASHRAPEQSGDDTTDSASEGYQQQAPQDAGEHTPNDSHSQQSTQVPGDDSSDSDTQAGDMKSSRNDTPNNQLEQLLDGQGLEHFSQKHPVFQTAVERLLTLLLA